MKTRKAPKIEIVRQPEPEPEEESEPLTDEQKIRFAEALHRGWIERAEQARSLGNVDQEKVANAQAIRLETYLKRMRQ
jgi:hypothetical protein